MFVGRNAWATAAVIYLGLAAGTIHLTSTGSDIATVWPANAVLLALLLDASGRREWVGILGAGFVANVLANLITRGTGIGPLLFGLCNLVEVSVAALLLRPALRNMNILGAPAVVGRFIVVAGAVAPLTSAVGGASTAWLLYGQAFETAFWTWLLSDSLGLLIFTPFLRALLRGEYIECFRGESWRGRLEAVGLQVLTGVLAAVVFFVASRPLLFLLFGPVMLATFRTGRLGAKMSVLVIAIVGAIATIHDVGPIAAIAADHREQAHIFQAYLAALLLTCLPAAADLSARADSFQSVADNATALEAREVELSRLATTDSLTGVLNRAAFQDCAELAMRNESEGMISLLALDLDAFKLVNDQHGHQAGDKALVHLASVLQTALRGRDIIGRVGGDEFLILLPSADRAQAEIIAARLTQSLRNSPLQLSNGVALLLSMSCGVARYYQGMNFDDLAHAADMALYARKTAKRSEAGAAA